MYTETLGRWHTVDLFVGLAYLSHREANEYPALDIAYRGRPVSLDQSADKTHALLVGRTAGCWPWGQGVPGNPVAWTPRAWLGLCATITSRIATTCRLCQPNVGWGSRQLPYSSLPWLYWTATVTSRLPDSWLPVFNT